MACRKHLVLLVDDDQAVREALQFALELEGLCVHVHNRGDGLLADPDLARAGCVVVDDRQRGMDGFAVLQQLKDRNVSIPSILLSGHVTDRIRDRARAAGVSLILEKPLMDNALRDTIRAIIGLRACPG
jgi:FixJ family two-component response regulator